MIRRPPISTLFPYTPLFRSSSRRCPRRRSSYAGPPRSSSGGWLRRARGSEENTAELPSHSYILNAVFFLNDTATPDIYPLSLHAALPIFVEALSSAEIVVRRASKKFFRRMAAAAS